MADAYSEIMGRVTVTPEMRRRVLDNISRADLSRAPERAVPVRFPSSRRILALAACLAVVLVGVLAGPKLLQKPTEEPPVETEPGITACGSAEELSKAVGFPVNDVSAALPFQTTDTQYTAYDGELGEISYTGADGQSAVYRKSPGADDNSGDYNDYASVVQVTSGGVTAALKGNGGSYSLAVWTDGAYSYSLSLAPGANQADWSGILDAVISS